MAWLALTLPVPEQQAEALSDALMELGALSVDVRDADAGTPEERALFGEPGEPAEHLWQRNILTALFPEDAPIKALVEEAASLAGLEKQPGYRVESLADNDWVRMTQSQFDPIPISKRLWIVPTWHAPQDPGAINIILDPGLAFGTGSHPTTRLCLKWLDANLGGGESVLDYGCGSGILAIAAKKLGAATVAGVDVDEQAIQASRDNAAANAVAADFYLPDDAPGGKYDIVVANILTNPLKLLAPVLAASVRPGGRIVLSGILEAQAAEVMKIYSQWFNLSPTVMDEGWACLSGVKQ